MASIHNFINREICDYGKSAQYKPHKNESAYGILLQFSNTLFDVCMYTRGRNAIKKDVNVLSIL